MKINVKGLKDGVSHVEETAPPEVFRRHDESLKLAAPLAIKMKITKMGEDLYFQAEIKTTVAQECARCMNEFHTPVDTKLEILYVPARRAVVSGGGLMRSQDDRVVGFYGEDQIDLTDDLCETIATELPMKPLCKPGCKGFCSDCGQDLNEGACDCQGSDESGESPFKAFFAGEE